MREGRDGHVPSAYRGLWRRRVLRTSESVDHSTKVLWLQTGSLYADLRIPADRHPAEPYSLAEQQGFAGMLEVDGNVLTWHRWLDFQPPGLADIGRITWEGDRMIERGVLADYYEEWERVAGWSSSHVALRLVAESDALGNSTPRTGVLLAVGKHFACALGRRAPMPVGSSLKHMLERNGCASADVATMLDCRIAFGCTDGRGWRVRAATHPGLESQPCFSEHAGWRRKDESTYLEHSEDGVTREWDIVAASEGFQMPYEP
jgi:hypothetical protein